ncbi:MAG: protein kinase domain-containing protein [Eubacteriales bacterium]|jgi:cellulose synthase/poly-beta-1,6-N-acetylglucosamine synthase-like glycosyltransferase
MRKLKNKRRRIPESLGNRLCGIRIYVIVLVIDAAAHGVLFFLHGITLLSFFRSFLSFLFFIYPLHYVADSLWSLRPSVCGILSGQTLINRKYYMNTVRKEVEREQLLPVTVSIPVYLESNEIIFDTMRQALAAAKRYSEFSGEPCNVVVSDDGIAPLLGGSCTKEKADALIYALKIKDPALTLQKRKAAERIRFYRANEIAFAVRPAEGRAGHFKKASNLNYTLKLGKAAEGGSVREELTRKEGAFAGGYFEGDITANEIILLLDKDSGVPAGIIEAILPEFAEDEKLAYVQCATNAVNLEENYYTRATGRHGNSLFNKIWPCKALQGFFVPLVGHNVFIRKSLLEKSGLWAENRVSEDYDKALCLYGMGYHGKYAQIHGLEFTEYTSRTFTEETGKQRRYAYGLFELLFDGTVFSGKLRGCDVFYMLLYFCSLINQVMLLPTVLIESYFGNIHLLWAGFLFCMLCFIIFPLIRTIVMRRCLGREHLAGFGDTLIIAVSFVGHSYSAFAGACRYLINKIGKIKTPFPTTNVDRLGYSFSDGAGLLFRYIRKNPFFIAIAFLCLDRGIFLLTLKELEPVTTFTYCYILFCAVLAPVLLTPQLYSGFFQKAVSTENRGVRGLNLEKDTVSKVNSMPKPEYRELSPLIIDKESPDTANDDIESFLAGYQKTLQTSLAEEGMPEELLSEYIFESCIRKDAGSRKELYLLKRIEDGAKALLRITKNYPEEDALEEAKLLRRLDHPGVPKVLFSCEKDGKSYLVREYAEGRTLHEIVTEKGCLSAEDIYGIAGKLADILSYLHRQTPPVIHRDIKPQNIIAGTDGSIHLIDFGIAREHKQQRRQDTSIVLTLDYASPEQYGFEQTTPLSDIYSLGVVLLFLCTGRTVRSDLEAQIVNNSLRELISQCIAFNPKMRIQSADEISEFLARSSRKALRRKRRYTTAAVIAAAALCFSFLAYGSGYLVGRGRAEALAHERGYQAGYTDGYRTSPQLPRDITTESDENAAFDNMAVPGGAFAAEGEGLVFYISDEGIRSMAISGTNPKLVVNGTDIRALSYKNGWLYYSSGDKIMQTNIYSSESDLLDRDTGGRLLVTGEYFYILTSEGVSLLDVKTGEIFPIKSLSGCKILKTDGEQLYFIGGEDGALYRCNLAGEDSAKLFDGTCKDFTLSGNDIFCMAELNGTERLIRIDADTGEAEPLTEISADMLISAGNGICFLDTSDSRIWRCSPDGRIRQRISANRARDFNLAGGWVLYHNEDDGGRLWCVRLDGSNDHPMQSGR